MRYTIPFNNNKQRTVIRKWVGRTRGASIARTSEDFWMDTDGEMIWGTSYVIEAKTGKTELLLKLQFPEACKYVPESKAFNNFNNVYFPGK